jgi:hypothetical protein
MQPQPGDVIDWALVTDAQLVNADKGLRWRLARWVTMNTERGAVILQSADPFKNTTTWRAIYRPCSADELERRRAFARRLEREAIIDMNGNWGRPLSAWLR